MNQTAYYLDHAAATPLDERVLAVMQPYLTKQFFNPSSPYAPAIMVRRDYDDAKSRLASTIGAKGDELIITAGATESINLAFSSVTGHVVTSSVEHHAVQKAAERHDYTLVQPNSKGTVSAEAVLAAVTPTTQLVSIQLANNEIGTIQPLRDIATAIDQERRRRGEIGDLCPLYFHCDASQGFGQIDVNVARLGVDMLTLNSGKIYGPKQVALLWCKPGVRVVPQIVGGGQERGLRSGTENVAGVVGFAKAAELAHSHRKSEGERLMKLRDTMQQRLTQVFNDKIVISGNQKKRLPGSLHVSFPGIDGERLVFSLETEGVYVATGSACAANQGTRSHVLTAIGMSEAEADGSLRITLGHLTSENHITKATDIIIRQVQQEMERVRA
jgi:cysteine desulfurase